MSEARSEKSAELSPLGYPARLLAPGQTYAGVTDTIASIPLAKHPPRAVVHWVRGRIRAADDAALSR